MTDRATIIARHLEPYVRPQEHLLEIGAGKGQVARALKQSVQVEINLVDVVDYNETDLRLELYDGHKLPFGDRSFDYSLLVFVLHHTPDPRTVLLEAMRVSRSGVLVVENHVEGWVRQQFTRVIDSVPHWQHGVPICYHAYTLAEWRRLFEHTSLRAEILSKFNLGFFWENFVARITPEQ